MGIDGDRAPTGVRVVSVEAGRARAPGGAEALRHREALIGRESVLAVLAPVVERAVRGRAELVLLTGEAGIGKTTLARNIAATAAADGAQALWGPAWDGDGAPPFWPWTQALRNYVEVVGGHIARQDVGTMAGPLARLLPELADDEPGRPTGDPEHARFLLFDAVATFLGRATQRAPIVLVLDDLHWADESSLRLLAFLVRRLPTARLLVVGTYRDTEFGDSAAGRLLREQAAAGTCVPLSRLSASEVALLLADVTGVPPDDALAASVHHRSGGNPFFARELGSLLVQGDRSTVPMAVRELVQRRVAGLPTELVASLQAAAVIGPEVGLDVLAKTTGRAPSVLVELLDEAVRRQVLAPPPTPLGPYAFAHDLFRETLYEGLGAVERAALHLSAADALEADPSAGRSRPAEVARHLASALPLSDRTRTVAAVARAAEQSLRQLAYEKAVAHWERALDILAGDAAADDDLRLRLLLDLADARRRAGRLDAAQAAYEEADDLARAARHPTLRAEAALGLHELGTVTGRRDTAGLARLRQALAGLGDEDHPLRARLLASLARQEYHAGPDWVVTMDEAEEAVAVARRVGDPGTLAFCLLALHDTRWRPGTAAERVDIATEMAGAAERADEPERLFEAVMLRLTALLELGDPAAGPELDRLARLGAELCRPGVHYYVLTRRAGWCILSGDLAEGERLAREAVELGRSIGVPDATLVFACHILALRRARGRPQSLLPETGPLPPQDYPHFHRAVEGLDALYAGDPARARTCFVPYVGNLERLLDLSGHSGNLELALLAEGFLGTGLVEGCRQAYELLLPHAGEWIVAGGAVVTWGAVSHHLGLLAEATGDFSAAVAHLEAALGMHERLSARPWMASTELALGRLLLRGHDRERGRRLVDEARAGAASVGMELPAGPTASVPTFVRVGAVWRLDYADRTAHLPDSKGLRDLARLVGGPGEEVHVSELVAVAEGGADAVLDDRAKAAYRRRLADLEEEVADAEAAHDLGRLARAREERAAVIEELERAVGLGGRTRRLGDPTERARKAVAARLRDALARIEAEHPALGGHLRASVRTGTFCSYRPPDPA